MTPAIRAHLLLVLLLPCCDGAKADPHAALPAGSTVAARQEMYPLALRYREDIRYSLALLPAQPERTPAPAAIDPATGLCGSDAPALTLTGPRLLAVLMS